MTTREQWLDLAERCEKATGPDREIDKSMLSVLGWGATWRAINLRHTRYAWFNDQGGELPASYSPTASLDAITALIERELPGWGCSIRRKPRDKVCTAHIGTSVTVSVQIQQKPAIVLCAAFCRAMAEKA